MNTPRSAVIVLALLAACGGPSCDRRPPAAEPAAASTPPPPSVAVAPVLTSTPASTGGLSEVAERCIDSVVNISSTRTVHMRERPQGPFFDDPFFRELFGPGFRFEGPKDRREMSLGSGVIVTADGYVLTNNHVIEEAQEIRVTLADRREFEAKLVGADAKSDVAVIKLEGEVEDLKPLPFGDSGRLRLGEVVLAIGSPFGLGSTVTAGIVSAKGRADLGIVDYEDFIQTDAAINPGNSGGALVNLNGELVGINTAIMSRSGGYQGVGFAIPSQMARAVMDSLVQKGKVVRGWLGVAIQDIDRELGRALGVPAHQGVLVSDVTRDSPARKAGLQRGDVIVKLDGAQMDSAARLRNAVASLGAKKKVEVVVLRDGQEKTLTVELGEMPERLADARGPALGAEGETPEAGAGLAVVPLTDDLRQELDLPADVKGGVVVTRVQSGSPAEEAGLRARDVILEAGRKPVDSPEALARAYRDAEGSLLLLVHRGGSAHFVVMKVMKKEKRPGG